MNDATREAVVEKIEQTVETAEEIVRHPFTKKIAELGFYTKGVLFIIIGILALMVAFGQRGGELTDPTGALTIVAQFTFGKTLLIIFIVGALLTLANTAYGKTLLFIAATGLICHGILSLYEARYRRIC